METLKKIWQAIDKAVFTAVKYACVLLLAVLVCVVFYIFFGRYVLNNSPMWGEPLSLFCLVWMSILGSALCIRDEQHLRVTMFDTKMGKKSILATDILASVCMFVFAIFLIVYGWQLTQKGLRNNMAGINIPYAYMYVAMPVSGVLYIMALIEMWRRRLVKA